MEAELEEFDGAIGIDLGTTYSCVAVFRNDAVEVIANDQGNRTTPSYVAFHNGDVLVGDAAKNLASRGAKGVVFDAKRMIGRRFSDKSVQEDMKHWPFPVEAGEGDRILIPVEHKGETLRLQPEQVSARVLEYLKSCAEAYLGKRVRRAVITVPAYFNDAQRERTKAAAAIAGLEALRIVNEPTAAALCYGLGTAPSERPVHALVFDFGGGTFDVSVITMDSGSFAVRATAGDTHLGGQDVDAALLGHVAADMRSRHQLDCAEQPRLLARLRARCEQAKRVLSHATAEEFALDGVLDGGEAYTLRLTRAKLEELCAAVFDRCMAVVRRALKDAGMAPSEVDEVILVGGSSRIPRLRSMLQEAFSGRHLNSSVHPDEAVAIGAAVQASILSTAPEQKSAKTEEIVLMDVVPLSIGVEIDDGKFDVIIKRNTTIPYRATKEYSTVEDNQNEVEVQVFEGERPQTRHNHFLGSFILDGITRAPSGEPTITVTFAVDADGILTITASEALANTTKSLVVANSERLSEAEVREMIETAQKLSSSDAVTHKLTGAFRALDEALQAVPVPYSSKLQKRIAFLAHGKEWVEQQLPHYTDQQEVETKVGKIMKLVKKALSTARRESGKEKKEDNKENGNGGNNGGSRKRERSESSSSGGGDDNNNNGSDED